MICRLKCFILKIFARMMAVNYVCEMDGKLEMQ